MKSFGFAIMKWLASVRAMLAGGSRSAPVSPAASPVLPSKADLHAKQVRCLRNQCGKTCVNLIIFTQTFVLYILTNLLPSSAIRLLVLLKCSLKNEVEW